MRLREEIFFLKRPSKNLDTTRTIVSGLIVKKCVFIFGVHGLKKNLSQLRKSCKTASWLWKRSQFELYNESTSGPCHDNKRKFKASKLSRMWQVLCISCVVHNLRESNIFLLYAPRREEGQLFHVCAGRTKASVVYRLYEFPCLSGLKWWNNVWISQCYQTSTQNHKTSLDMVPLKTQGPSSSPLEELGTGRRGWGVRHSNGANYNTHTSVSYIIYTMIHRLHILRSVHRQTDTGPTHGKYQ